MTLVRTLPGICFVLLLSNSAWAQYWGGAAYPNFSSTAAEGAQRGFADVVRSAGEFNLNTSQAAINYEQARSMYFSNRLQATNTYFEMRSVNRQARAAEASPRLSQEQLYRIAAESAPRRLSSSSLDPLSGDINWPMILTQDQYAPQREKLQALFAERANSGGALGPENYLEIQQIVQTTLADLRANISNYPSSDYLQARRFLEQLAFTARTPST